VTLPIQNWNEPILSMKALLAVLDLDRRGPLANKDPIRRWSKGRVAPLGGAAHASPQSLAQGASSLER